MRSFWGFYDNRKYRVGCNGSTIYVFDTYDRELAKFRDIAYAYTGDFKPKSNVFIAKSIEGKLAVYDLDHLTLLKKSTISRIGAQDEGFAFTPDGREFLNIEKPISSLDTQLVIYDTFDFSRKRVLFINRSEMLLEELEFDEFGNCYVLGFIRDAEKIFEYGFAGMLIDNEIQQITKLMNAQYHYASAYLAWKRTGFTPKALHWGRIYNFKDKPEITIRELLNGKLIK